MKMKRIACFFMAILFVFSCGTEHIGDHVYASDLSDDGMEGNAAKQYSKRYYYAQLPDEAKSFYDAMYQMYVQGILKTGTGDYDLVSNGHLTQEQLESYANGNMTLLNDMGAARDAFYADYPEIFYVDFSYLSLRVTRNSSKYCAYLGTGRSDNYFVKGFTSREEVEAAEAEYEDKVKSIVEGAKKLTVEEGKSLAEQQVKYVHDEIIWHTSYRLEDTCKKENIGHIRTAYGALVKGESLCEGYARAVKAVLDRLDIPCVLVQGGYIRTTDKIELHMWNYVQVESKWYGLDATMDDPIPPSPGEGGLDGFERSDYLLVGEDVMGRRHIPDGVMSEAGFEFAYPAVAGEDRLFQEVANDNGLKVLYSKDAVTGELQTGVYKVSYYGMGAGKTIENGKYMVMREAEYNSETKTWTYGRWAYILPDAYKFVDTETEAVLDFPGVEYLEFAVTEEAPGDYKNDTKYLSFYGNPLLFDARTEILYNPNGTYTPPPYVKKATPSFTTSIKIGKTYHMSITYDEDLKLADNTAKADVAVSVLDENTSAMEYCKIGNFAWNGSTVTFDFKPSEMWLDDCVTYHFDIKGLIGVESEKTPNSFSYTAIYKNPICAYRARGYYWNVFGKPQLLENSDLSEKNFQEWKTEEGSSVTPEMMTGLTLVASSPSHAQTDTMNHMINEQLSAENVLKSETYNIRLLICRQSLVSVGDSIRLSVGFPVGYGPDDEGVTFKAYHFKRNSSGEITGMEEVPCTVTRYGLVILCKSFSPFAVVAVKDNGAEVKTSKSLIVSGTQGGCITGTETGILTLAEGERRQLTITAKEGYAIDAVAVGGKYQEIIDHKSMTVNVDYKDASDGDIIEAQFVAETVRQKEEDRGETIVRPVPVPARITLASDSVTVGEKERIEIVPEITLADGIHAYQWYKDGVLLKGQNREKLMIESAAKEDEGNYSLEIKTVSGAASVTSRSGICKVTVISSGYAENTEPDLKAVSGLKASSEKPDRVKLQWKAVADADGYQVFRYDESEEKYVKIANTAKTVYTDKRKTSGKSYRYKVKAYKKMNGRTYYGRFSKEVKIIVMPKAPTGIAAKRLSETSVQISFKPVVNATSYYIYKYKKKSDKQTAAYKVTDRKLYKYNAKKKKWVYENKVKKAKNGRTTCELSGLKKSDENMKYCIKAVVSRKGYKLQYSLESKSVKIK